MLPLFVHFLRAGTGEGKEDLGIATGVHAFLKKESYDAIVVNTSIIAVVYVCFLGARGIPHVKLIAHAHNTDLFFGKGAIRRKFLKAFKIVSIVMVGIPFSIIGISRSEWLWLSNRFAEYFFLFLIVLIPKLIDSGSESANRIGVIAIHRKNVPFWAVMIVWHAAFAILMFNNNFASDTYLFQ